MPEQVSFKKLASDSTSEKHNLTLGLSNLSKSGTSPGAI